MTDLPEVKEKFSFPLPRKKTAGAQFDSSFQHQVLLMRSTKFIHCLDSLTNFSRCMSSLIFLAPVQAVMTNITCFLSIFVMFLKYTPFSRTYYAPINVKKPPRVGGRQGMGWGFDIFQKFAVKFPAHGQIIPVKCNQGCLPFDRKFRKFRMEGKW